MTQPPQYIDLFAAAGGWDEGARLTDAIDADRILGIEWDPSACATAEAAGHQRLCADVAALNPHDIAAPRTIRGGFMSPPCQGFSMGGGGGGRRDTPLVMAALDALPGATMEAVDAAIAAVNAAAEDPRSALVLEPLRWTLALDLEWVLWEQVRAVKPLWEACAAVLRAAGYSVWTGVVDAADYGVPQNRHRAILIASRVRTVTAPTPTHAKDPARHDSLSGNPPLPWVTIGDALGVSNELLGFPRRVDRTAGTITIDGIDYRARDLRPSNEPSFTLTEKARSWRRYTHLGDVYQTNGAIRSIHEPAPTLTASMDNGNFRWIDQDAPPPKAAARVAAKPIPGRPANPDPDAVPTSRPLSVNEAAVLQTFPADHPWQGSNSNKFLQIGNAVPPLLAARLIDTATGGTQ